ncbi:MAG: hypothetical protein KAU50_07185, partial [Candidatus Marinimicrobia bacterium]|nr:hypothetical protein [Candidatus Neomarinimicrobiota bacterium]
MNINDIFRKIESHETSAQLNLTSNLRHFFMYAERVECIQELKNALKDTICITETLKRILSLSKEDIDFRYENPYDSAITIYLWVLFLQSEIAGKVAANIASKLRHGWWAPRYARKVLKEDVYFTPTTIEEVGEEREYS